jgi:hypothetical protein
MKNQPSDYGYNDVTIEDCDSTDDLAEGCKTEPVVFPTDERRDPEAGE